MPLVFDKPDKVACRSNHASLKSSLEISQTWISYFVFFHCMLDLTVDAWQQPLRRLRKRLNQ